MMDLSNYSIDELVSMKHEIEDHIFNYKDGYEYICCVRSYGRNWEDKSIHNIHTLKDLLSQYDGEDGIVDVYSTNPDLCVYNYGSLMYIKSREDYLKWNKYNSLKNLIITIENLLDKWDNKDNLPFYERPLFPPSYTKEDLDEYKQNLDEFDMSFTPPCPYIKDEVGSDEYEAVT